MTICGIHADENLKKVTIPKWKVKIRFKITSVIFIHLFPICEQIFCLKGLLHIIQNKSFYQQDFVTVGALATLGALHYYFFTLFSDLVLLYN